MFFDKLSGHLKMQILKEQKLPTILYGSIQDFNLSHFSSKLKAGKVVEQLRTTFAHKLTDAVKVTDNTAEDWLRFIQHIFYTNQSATISYKLVYNETLETDVVEATIIF